MMIGSLMPTSPNPIVWIRGRDAAGEKIRVDQHRNLVFRQMKGAATIRGAATAFAYITSRC
jgi:hypothetical protein